MYFRSGGTDPGRDGCRVPLPVVRRRAAVRLQPDRHRSTPGCRSRPTGRDSTVERQAADPDSMLALYRAALRLRREPADLGDGR